MLVPYGLLALFHLAPVVFLLVAGHVVLVVPARDRPHCLVPARCTHLGVVGGYAVGGLLGLWAGEVFGPWSVSGLAVGGVGGEVIGHLARVVLVGKGEGD